MGKNSELHVEMNEQNIVRVQIDWKSTLNNRYTSEVKEFENEQHWQNFYDKASTNHGYRKMIGSTVLKTEN